MNAARTILALLVTFMIATVLFASGTAAVCGVIEKVVFEPNEQSPQRVQIWGAFALVEAGNFAGPTSPQGTTVTRRGYLYFELAENAADQNRRAIRAEWADLKSMAGTGRGVSFGQYGYIGTLTNIVSDNPRGSNYLLGPGMRVRNADEQPSKPDRYMTNIGVVKLAVEGSHAALVNQLKQLLNKQSR